MELANKRCVPCEGGVPRLGAGEVQLLLAEVPGWRVDKDLQRIEKRFTFADFADAIGFVNKMADLAETEGHHPDFAVHYNVVDVTLYTHVIKGLSENDFILAAKLNRI